MAEQSLPWPGLKIEGAAGDAGGYTAGLFAELVKAVMEDRTGVINGLAVVASSPAGGSVTVTAGKAIIRGRLYVLDADLVLAVGDNTSGNARIDRVVLQANYDTDVQAIRAAVKVGMPAASPSVPTLTQNEGVMWEMPLAQLAVANGFSSITESDITRERTWARDESPGDLHDSYNPNLEATGRYLKRDGRAVSRTTYRDLFDAIGTQHGSGDGSTTFNLPDDRGRGFACMDNMGTAEGSANVITDLEADTVGGQMGEEKHALTENENGPHVHYYAQGLISNNFSGGSSGAQVNGGSNSYATTSSGLGTPHNTVQPTSFGYGYIRL